MKKPEQAVIIAKEKATWQAYKDKKLTTSRSWCHRISLP
jgi:hypothetical protein